MLLVFSLRSSLSDFIFTVSAGGVQALTTRDGLSSHLSKRPARSCFPRRGSPVGVRGGEKKRVGVSPLSVEPASLSAAAAYVLWLSFHERLVGGASDGNSHTAGMFCSLMASTLAATPSPLCQAFQASSLSPRNSATTLPMYVWTQPGLPSDSVSLFVSLWRISMLSVNMFLLICY